MKSNTARRTWVRVAQDWRSMSSVLIVAKKLSATARLDRAARSVHTDVRF